MRHISTPEPARTRPDPDACTFRVSLEDSAVMIDGPIVAMPIQLTPSEALTLAARLCVAVQFELEPSTMSIQALGSLLADFQGITRACSRAYVDKVTANYPSHDEGYDDASD